MIIIEAGDFENKSPNISQEDVESIAKRLMIGGQSVEGNIKKRLS